MQDTEDYVVEPVNIVHSLFCSVDCETLSNVFIYTSYIEKLLQDGEIFKMTITFQVNLLRAFHHQDDPFRDNN